jgi:hypothetical protein
VDVATLPLREWTEAGVAWSNLHGAPLFAVVTESIDQLDSTLRNLLRMPPPALVIVALAAWAGGVVATHCNRALPWACCWSGICRYGRKRSMRYLLVLIGWPFAGHRASGWHPDGGKHDGAIDHSRVLDYMQTTPGLCLPDTERAVFRNRHGTGRPGDDDVRASTTHSRAPCSE